MLPDTYGFHDVTIGDGVAAVALAVAIYSHYRLEQLRHQSARHGSRLDELIEEVRCLHASNSKGTASSPADNVPTDCRATHRSSVPLINGRSDVSELLLKLPELSPRGLRTILRPKLEHLSNHVETTFKRLDNGGYIAYAEHPNVDRGLRRLCDEFGDCKIRLMGSCNQIEAVFRQLECGGVSFEQHFALFGGGVMLGQQAVDHLNDISSMLTRLETEVNCRTMYPSFELTRMNASGSRLDFFRRLVWAIPEVFGVTFGLAVSAQ
jgi:hypothetical protein